MTLSGCVLLFISKLVCMDTMTFESHSQSPLEQPVKNTSLWVGHLNADSADHFAGQTFQCPKEGELKEIQVFSDMVSHPGKLALTIREFDKESKQWGQVLSTSVINVDGNDTKNWMHFQFDALPLHKDITYGFQLKAEEEALVAIGEAVWPSKTPFVYGEEWGLNNFENKDHYYRYFSLAFKIAMRA